MHQHHRHHDRSRRLQESVHRTFEHSRGGGAKRGREEGGNNHSPYHHDDHGRHAHRERRWQHSEHETEEAAAHKRPRAETSASSSSAEASRLPLEEKFIDLLRCLTPTKEERGRRDAALQDVLRTLRSIGLRAEVYGSLRTGVLIPSSDIDCVMIPLEDKGRMPPALSSTMNNLAVASVLSSRERKQSFSRGIRVVANAMRSARCFRGITSVAHAKVPIVKCIHRNDDIKIDLSFEKDGCTSSQFLCDEFQKPGNELARPLIILVKSLVTHHGLDDPSMGGLGSFPISLMVLFYLKTEVPANYPEELQQSVAVLFAGFLRFFSGRFDFRRSGIDYVRANTFTKPPSTELFIVNPVRPGTNCAKAATLFATRVVPCFQEASKVFCGLLEHHADERRIEEAMCRFFSSAVPACADWREVEKAARHCRAAPPNRWDEHTHIYTGGVL